MTTLFSLQLMHDAARLAPLAESLAVVLRTGRNAIVAYRLDPDVGGAYRAPGGRLDVEPGSSILGQASRVAPSTCSASLRII